MTENVRWHKAKLSRDERWSTLSVQGATIWFTGLSAAGKSTIAAGLEAELIGQGIHTYRLDGDNVRHGLNADLGFSAEDRAENVRRVGEVARLFADSGVVCIASLISPYAAERQRSRDLHADWKLPFLEVFVDAPLAVCEERDPKGLYKKARAGELRQFTGIDDPYEAPESADLVLPTADLDISECVERCLALLRERELLAGGAQ